jgi:SAM-dependent methyltransferase
MSEIFDQWDLYARVVANDYMRHRELAAQVRGVLGRYGRPVRVLDAGCGDGSLARRCLGEVQLDRYVGIDLSADALTRARSDPPAGNGPRPAEVILICQDLLEAIPALDDDEFDVVLASYSLHHFSQASKRELLRQIARILKTTDSLFVWSDMVRRPGQTRAEYLAAMEQEMRSHWSALSPAELEQTIAHINESDFPEEESWMLEAARQCGLRPVGELFRDPFHGCWCFTADPAGVAPV